MALLLISFLAGILSVLAPCVISLLPILLAKSVDGKRSRSPFFIIGGLSASIFLFSILLKASTLLIDVPTRTWQIVSGVIVVGFGLISLFPEVWEKISLALHFSEKANKTSGKALQKQGHWGDLLLGASLGPVFTACSPTYFLIVATILPATPAKGVLYLLVFITGLASMLTLITFAGSKVVQKLGWGINPKGWFKRMLGIIFILLGLMILTGFDKKIQTYVVEQGWFDWQVSLESRFNQE